MSSLISTMEEPHMSKSDMDSSDQGQIEDEFSSDDYTEDDSDEELSSSLRQKKKTVRQRDGLKISSKLAPQLKGLMGEANLRVARGDTDTAQKMCYEVIRQQPNAWEPYLTLAQIYESTDHSKCKGYLTIASYLNPGNSSTWCRLAEISVDEGNIREAINFYSRCLNYDGKNIEVHRRRLKLADNIGDQTMIRRFQESLISKLPPENYEEIIKVASELTQYYHKEKRYERALNVLHTPFRTVPQHVTPDLVNIMLELLLMTNKFPLCLDVFVDFCNFNFEIVFQQDESIQINDYSMPEDISIDLKTKFIICAVKLKCFEVANKLIDTLVIEEDVEVVGDLFLDICEALVAVNRHDMALKLFVPLKKSKTFSLAGVWLKYADCLAACGLKEQAIEGYFTVITLAPQHIEVLYPLAELLLDMNKKEEALEVMAYQTTERLNVGVLMLRLKLLQQIGDTEEYWRCMELLFSRHCAVFRTLSEIKAVLTVTKSIDKINRLKKIREFRNDSSPIIPNKDVICVMEPAITEEYEIFKEALSFAKKTRNYEEMQKLALMAVTSKKFEKYYDEITLFSLFACLYNGDLYHGYFLAREAVMKHPNNNFFWNIFNLFAVDGDPRFSKFIYRFRMKMQNHEACEVLEANSDFYFANYNGALKYFVQQFKETNSPYVSFILGVITLHLSTISKNIPEDTKKQLSETSTYLFLNYGKSRSKNAQQEIFYNLARMYQQLGLMHLAEHYYKQVFEVENEYLNEHPDILCLKYEAAYNLHHIYKNSGNLWAARNILMKYLVI